MEREITMLAQTPGLSFEQLGMAVAVVIALAVAAWAIVQVYDRFVPNKMKLVCKTDLKISHDALSNKIDQIAANSKNDLKESHDSLEGSIIALKETVEQNDEHLRKRLHDLSNKMSEVAKEFAVSVATVDKRTAVLEAIQEERRRVTRREEDMREHE